VSVLEVEGLTVAYGDALVVDRLDFAIGAGESVGLVGESGSGKTQTALAILGLLPPAAHVGGSARLGDTELIGAPAPALDAVRARRIAMVFQDPLDALNPYLRIGDQLALILVAHSLATRAEARRRVLEMLGRVGLPDPPRQYLAFPHQLSGGMRQRAMIAAALLAEPDLLVADEPTTALDVTVQAQILALLDELRDQTALLLITHDLAVVAQHCDRLLVLDRGRLAETGPVREVFAAPRAPVTRAMLALARSGDGSAARAPIDAPALLRLADVGVAYRLRAGRSLRAVKSAELALNVGETLAIVGESGSGKSSLAKALMGLVPADTGKIMLDGDKIPADLDARSRAIRRDLQFVFQDPFGSLNPQLDVATIVAEPLTVHRPQFGAADRRRLAGEAVAAVGLDAGFLDRHPHELSGGQAQRVAIARAIVSAPRVLVCDEAVAALDGAVRAKVLAVLEDVQAKTGLAIVFISHDLSVVRTFSHRVAVMYLGRIVEIADARSLFSRPRHPYTRALLDATPVADPAAPARPPPLAGEIPSPLAPPAGCEFHPRCPFSQDRCAAARPALEPCGASLVACYRAAELDLAGATSQASG
jgi:peptide/nickel transport system ATP-binding protein